MQQKSPKSILDHLPLIGAAIVIVGIIIPAAIYYLHSGWEVRAQVGDMMGAPTAWFSACALIFIVITMGLQIQQLKMQRDELAMQREEMRLQREEFARTAEAQKESAWALEEQTKVQRRTIQIKALSSLLEETKGQIKALSGTVAPDDQSDYAKRMREGVNKLLDRSDELRGKLRSLHCEIEEELSSWNALK